METQNTMKSQSNLEKNKSRNLKLGRIRLLVFRLYCKDTETETYATGTKNRNIDQWNKMESPEINPCT